MGVGRFFGRGRHICISMPKVDINPNPQNFTITEIYEKGKACAITVKYPNCTNYEGYKIIVYPFSYSDVKQHAVLNGLDPHFSDTLVVSPFARFEPTNHGWAAAKDLVDILDKLED